MTLHSVEMMALWISLKVATVAVVLNLPFAVFSGYLLARWKSRGKTIFETFVNLPLVLPPIVTGYLLLIAFGRNGPIGSFLYQWFGLRITFTWVGAVLAAAVVSFPLMVRAIRLSFSSIDPRLEAAARSLGANRLDAFFTISLPLALRGIISGCVLGFARSIGEFGATIMIAGNIINETQTIPLAIFSLVQRPDGIAQSWRLVILSVILACSALAISEIIERKERLRETA